VRVEDERHEIRADNSCRLVVVLPLLLLLGDDGRTKAVGPAHHSGWANIRHNSKVCPDGGAEAGVKDLQGSLDTLHSTFGFDQDVDSRFPDNAEELFEKFSKHKNAKLASSLQGFMSNRIQDASHAALHELATTEEKAVLNCRLCPVASAWLQAMPHTADQQLSDFEVRFGVAHATNQLLPTLPRVCYCGGAVTTDCTWSLALTVAAN